MKQIATTPDILGHILKRERKKQHQTQQSLGQTAGLGQKVVSKLESGNEGTRLSTLFQVLAVLELELVVQPRNTPLDINPDIHEGDRW